MHIASALISTAVAAASGTGSGGALVASGVKMKKDSTANPILMGAGGAAVFSAQMMNFSIVGTGSSGHIGGGFFLASILGPFPAYIVMSIILTIQSLFFADGGLLALGVNILNMGVIPCFVVYPIISKLFFNKSKVMEAVGFILGGTASMVLGAGAVVIEAAISGTIENMWAFIANMLVIHLLIGLAEGVISGVLYALYRKASEISEKTALTGMSILALITGGFLSLFASSNPDGLEWALIKTTGTAELTSTSAVHELFDNIQSATSLLPDYAFKAVESALSSGAAGIIGTAAVFAAAMAVGLVLSRKKENS